MPTLDLVEWQQATPQSHVALSGLVLDLPVKERATLARLEQQPMVTIRELREGVSVSATSFVGSIRAGSLMVRISPKLKGRPFSSLLGYAVGLPITLLPEHDVDLIEPAFQDLLVSRLTAEASRLIARGVYRTYLTRQESLTSARGRIVFNQLARGPLMTATLPCRFDERHDNVLPNRVLLSGLQLAGRVAVDPAVRMRALRSAMALAERVEGVALTADTFRALDRRSSRLTSAYEPSFALIRLLMAGVGIGLDAGSTSTGLPGFLLDMNRLFQDALERFLREWLEDAKVMSQYRLQNVFRYDPRFNPRRQQSPTPRPDYVLTRAGHVVAIADAKYRDLWEQSLPPNMLYQLSLYALSQAECQTAIILYATTTAAAREARIVVTDPFRGGTRAHVVLRPVCLPELAGLVGQARTVSNDRRRRAFATYLAYGMPFHQISH
jgi:5-methylcytosine-specific restriction enzyme subunit McrC